MIKTESAFLSSDRKTNIHVITWTPDEAPKGVLQIAHGMIEFIDRYDRFARVLCDHGWLVTGNDHLGHGQSVVSEDDLGYFAEPDGAACVIDDMHTLFTSTKAQYPDVPYVLMGHSMGSFMTRRYISLHGHELDGAIVMGTGTTPDAVLKAARTMTKLLTKTKGARHRSKLMAKTAFGSYNKQIDPVRTPNDWLTKDEAIVDAYNANPLNTFLFTMNGYDGLFSTIAYIQEDAHVASIPKDLPILLVAGEADPVGNYGEGVKAVYESYKAAGIKDVEMTLFPNDRHEILNETDKEDVDARILTWLQRFDPTLS